MRHRSLVLLTVTLVAFLACTGFANAADYRGHWRGRINGPHYDYYLALGDSLAAGWQPNPVTGVGAITDKGYTADIAAWLHRADPRLRYTDLACPGETSTSMLDGGCPYPEAYSSQIAAATAFLTAHRGARILVTLDIGANNIDGCVSASGVDTGCIASGLAALSTDLPKILAQLAAAGGRGASIYAMTYYDPFLADWLSGAVGQQLATQSVTLAAQFNGILDTIYGDFHVPEADVSGRFDTSDITPLVSLSPTVTVPLNVARICEWTWMCAPPPVGPNIHANSIGYQQIAWAFEHVVAMRR